MGDAGHAEGISVLGPTVEDYIAKALTLDERWIAKFDTRSGLYVRGKLWKQADGEPAQWDVQALLSETEDALDRWTLWLRAGNDGTTQGIRLHKVRAFEGASSGQRIVKELIGYASGTDKRSPRPTSTARTPCGPTSTASGSLLPRRTGRTRRSGWTSGRRTDSSSARPTSWPRRTPWETSSTRAATLWQAATEVERADLLHAIYAHITVTRDGFVEAELTPDAYAHGLALSMRESLYWRPRQVSGPLLQNRMRRIVRVPIVGRREWLKLARSA